MEDNANISNYQKAMERKPVVEAVYQRHLNAKASIADITVKVENE
jgi:hypothetical protein